jgi:enoyl-CoA hydratase/carnithine racemase
MTISYLTWRSPVRIASVTINNPPINIITPQLYQELVGLVAELKDDDGLSVVVFKSADPDFFIAHYDVANILKFPYLTVMRNAILS